VFGSLPAELIVEAKHNEEAEEKALFEIMDRITIKAVAETPETEKKAETT
jgi:hypothetical protein